MRTEFLKDVNAKDVLFTRTNVFVAEATEEIGGAPVWAAIFNNS
jgi:hypothetical protein